MLSLLIRYLNVFMLILLIKKCSGDNVTFVPEPIYITLADLPAPYNTSSAEKFAHVIPVPDNPRLYVPEGFVVKLFTDELNSPRWPIYTPSGDLIVSESRINRISCLIDNNNDGYPDERVTFADESNGLNYPFGMAFVDGYFYVGNRGDTRRYSWTAGNRFINGTGEIVMTYPATGHVSRTVLISPDNRQLYVTVGSGSNVDEEPVPRASVLRANLDGTNNITFTSGVRNPVGLAFHPITHDLYASVQERDELGDDLVPDYFTRINEGEFYGWPYAYLSPRFIEPRQCTENGTSKRPDLVAQTRTPDVLFQAHSAVLDMRFYTGTQFPDKYHNGAFAALRGSWNRDQGTGYKIVFIPFDHVTHRPRGFYEDFVYGFLTKPEGPDTFARPVGLLVLKDGSLLFTEDGNNRTYIVQYTAGGKSSSTKLSISIFLFISYLLNFFVS